MAVPVSYFPLVTSLLLIGVPLVCAFWGAKRFLVAAVVSASLVLLLFLRVYVPGWVLLDSARKGDPRAQYEMARWTENHSGQMNAMIFWPTTPDVLGGYYWLERSAAQDYPPAMYALGVRLKKGIFVPQPPNWSGAGGNVFPQPERGQPLIDRALELGFEPMCREEAFYWQVYRE